MGLWLIGDDHRWAAAAIVLLALVPFVLLRSAAATYLRLAVLAALFAVLAFMTGELTALSLLVTTTVVLSLISAVRDVWHTTHRPMTT